MSGDTPHGTPSRIDPADSDIVEMNVEIDASHLSREQRERLHETATTFEEAFKRIAEAERHRGP